MDPFLLLFILFIKMISLVFPFFMGMVFFLLLGKALGELSR
jgi:hypothetical protein